MLSLCDGIVFSGERLITVQTATSRTAMKTRDERMRSADTVRRNFSHSTSRIRSCGLEDNCGNQGLHLGRKENVPLNNKALIRLQSCNVKSKCKPIGHYDVNNCTL